MVLFTELGNTGSGEYGLSLANIEREGSAKL